MNAKDIERVALAAFAADRRMRGITYDLDILDPGHHDPANRYAAVYRTPDGARLLDYFDNEYAARAAIELFWERMAELLAPA